MNESAVSPPSLVFPGGGGFLPPQRDAYLREKALGLAIEFVSVLATNKLFAPGKVTDLDVAAAAKEFYTFLKGQA